MRKFSPGLVTTGDDDDDGDYSDDDDDTLPQALHPREEEGEKAEHCQQKLQENVWKVNFLSNVKHFPQTRKKKNNFHPRIVKIVSKFCQI